jgi:hypothetical protein
MSFDHGMAALNLDMPPRVPRTEYSAAEHWDLVRAVTGIDVDAFSSERVKRSARRRFYAAWNYDLIWNVLVDAESLGSYRTHMGHAVYAAEGTDYDQKVFRLFDDPEDVYAFDFTEALGSQNHAGLIKCFNTHYDAVVGEYPHAVNMTGIYITCMSGLIYLLGWDMLLTAAGLDSKRFGDFTNRYVKWVYPYFLALAESKAPVVMIHDDIAWTSGAFLHPDWYRRYIFPNYRRLFDPLRQAGKKIIFTSDGNYTAFIDPIAACGVHGFVLEPMTDMGYIAAKYGKTHAFAGNADTRILLSGSKEDIYAEVKRCMDIGKKCPGFFMAVGNHIPANTPVENALYYQEAYEKLSRR